MALSKSAMINVVIDLNHRHAHGQQPMSRQINRPCAAEIIASCDEHVAGSEAFSAASQLAVTDMTARMSIVRSIAPKRCLVPGREGATCARNQEGSRRSPRDGVADWLSPSSR